MVAAIIGCVVSFRSFPPPPASTCPAGARPDLTYVAGLEPSPRSGIHDYDVTLYHRGSPAGGVRVCLRAAMNGMPEMEVKAQALDPDTPRS